MDQNKTEHWNKAYIARNIQDLGWYENESTPSLDLIEKCQLEKEDRILNVGVGSSTLVDSLVSEGYKNLIVSDLSDVALNQLKERIGETSAVTYIVDDLTNSKSLQDIQKVNLWYDRAVLHFFTEEKEQDAYFNLLKKLVADKGFVILAEFAFEIGAEKCCNLNVFRYSADMLQEKLGKEFTLLHSFPHNYINPRGESRPYIYTLFQRI